MQRLRFRIIKKRKNNYQLFTNNVSQKINRYMREKIYAILDNGALPLVIAPAIFILFVGLEWWHWYIELPTPSPILLTIIAMGVGIYCFFKLSGHKKFYDRQMAARPSPDHHPELH
jgi:hypothetical protein